MSADTLPIALGQYSEDTDGNLDDLLGQVFRVGNKTYRLVELNKTGGFVCGKKVFKWSDRTAWTVEPADAATEYVVGVGAAELGTESVPTGAKFLIQIDGPVTLILGASATATAVGEGVSADDDTDQGKCGGTGAAIVAASVPGLVFAVAREVQSTDDGEFLADIIGPLVI